LVTYIDRFNCWTNVQLICYTLTGINGRLLRERPDVDAGENMSYQVTMTDVEARPTAVVPATTTWQEFPTLWRELSDEVWACLHAGGIYRGSYRARSPDE
jgi:hypothetical protein